MIGSPPSRSTAMERRPRSSPTIRGGSGARGSADLPVHALASLLGSRTKARALIDRFGSAGAALIASHEELAAEGLGRSALRRLLACRKLATHLLSPNPIPHISGPGPLARFVVELAFSPREEVWVVAVDSELRPLVTRRVARGSPDTCPVEPRSILAVPLRVDARRYFVAHNHPSGNPTPSPDDLALTARLAEASRVIGLELLDHLVVTRERWSSCVTSSTGRVAAHSPLDLQGHRDPTLAAGEVRHAHPREGGLDTGLEGRIAPGLGADTDLRDAAGRHREGDLRPSEGRRLQRRLPGTRREALARRRDDTAQVRL